MLRVKIKGYKKGNISIGILIILSIVLVNLILVIISVVNIYKGARVSEVKAYKQDRTIIEKSVNYDEIENQIIAIINDFVKGAEKDEKSLKEFLKNFKYCYIDKDEKYGIGYDSRNNVFFLEEDLQPRKHLEYYVKDGKILLKLKKL